MNKFLNVVTFFIVVIILTGCSNTADINSERFSIATQTSSNESNSSNSPKESEWASIATQVTPVESSSPNFPQESDCNSVETLLPATVEYFANVDKNSQPEKVVSEIGPCIMESSEIGLYVWSLDDGSEASVIFSDEGIEEIIIDSEDSHLTLYVRSGN